MQLNGQDQIGWAFLVKANNTYRPNANHPNPKHWEEIRKQAIERDGGACRCCEETEDLECHHRHYRNWGQERLEDVVMLCRQCHDSITSRLRSERYQGRSHTTTDTARITPNGIIDKKMTYDEYLANDQVKAEREKLYNK
jgi:hypothetical protein